MRDSATGRRARIIRSYFRELEKIVLSNVARFKKAEFSGSVLDAFAGDEGILEAHLDKVLADNVHDFNVFAQLSYSRFTAEDMPRNVQQRLVMTDGESIRRLTKLSANLYTDTTKNQIKNVIEKYKNDYDKMVKELKKTFKNLEGVSQSRSLVIARTEVQKLSNLGALRGGIEGGATHKFWIWSGIERDYHASIEATGAIPINEAFVSGLGNTLDYPGDASAPPEEVINCGCDMEFLVLSDEEAAELRNK